MDRDTAIAEIRAALKRRSGKAWSVKGGRGTAYGWIEIDAPPRRRTWQEIQTDTPEPPAPGAVYAGAIGITPYTFLTDGTVTDYASDPWAREAVEAGRRVQFNWEVDDPSKPFGHMGPADRKELASLLGLKSVGSDGESIPSSYEYREEYVARARGETPTVVGTPYWD